MTYDLRQQPGGHPKGDEVYSSAEFIDFAARDSVFVPFPAPGAVPAPQPTAADVSAKSKGSKRGR